MKNAITYQDQIFKILDKNKTQVVYNSHWLSKMDLVSVMKLMSQYTVARMLERADFKERYKEQKEISIIEFLYPLMQGYDSVELKSDVELGGHDQIFNLLVGRELQKSYGVDQQIVITMPLLEGLDGKMKMSKSYGNYIGFTDTPKDMFGKTMSVPDELMFKYYELLTDVPMEEINNLKNGVKSGDIHPKACKVSLAKIFVEMFYGIKAAEDAEKEFEAVFVQNKLPLDIPLYKINDADLVDGKISLAKLINLSGMLDSVGEAKRMIKGGGVKVNEEKVSDENMLIEPKQDMIISVGKRKFIKITCE